MKAGLQTVEDRFIKFSIFESEVSGKNLILLLRDLDFVGVWVMMLALALQWYSHLKFVASLCICKDRFVDCCFHIRATCRVNVKREKFVLNLGDPADPPIVYP